MRKFYGLVEQKLPATNKKRTLYVRFYQSGGRRSLPSLLAIAFDGVVYFSAVYRYVARGVDPQPDFITADTDNSDLYGIYAVTDHDLLAFLSREY